MKSKVRFTKEEIKQRNAAREILARDESAFPDPTTAQWHRGRANGVIKRTYAAAKARAEARNERDDKGRNVASPARIPNGVTREAWEAEQERVKNFLKAVTEGRVKDYASREPKPSGGRTGNCAAGLGPA